jgi:hypothetical protein
MSGAHDNTNAGGDGMGQPDGGTDPVAHRFDGRPVSPGQTAFFEV